MENLVNNLNGFEAQNLSDKHMKMFDANPNMDKIDKQMSAFSKMFGEDENDFSSNKNDDEKLYNEILAQAGLTGNKTGNKKIEQKMLKEKNEIEQMKKALALAEMKEKNKNNKDELSLKNLLGDNKQVSKKENNDESNDLNNIFMLAQKNQNKKDEADMQFIKGLLKDEENISQQKPEKKQVTIPKTSENSIQNKSLSTQEKMSKIICLLIQEYMSAKDYFTRNGYSEEKINDCVNKCKDLIMAQKKVVQNNLKEIKLSELPKQITPEYIFGYTNEERTSKFNNIISYYINQKKINANDKVKAPKFDRIIAILKEKMANKWTPCPLFSGTNLTKVYPAFDPKSAQLPEMKLNNHDKSIEKKEEKIETKTSKIELGGELKEQNVLNSESENSNLEKEKEVNLADSSSNDIHLTEEEKKNPDQIDFYVSLKVLEFKIKELSEKMKNIKGRTPKELMQFNSKMKVKKMQLENSMENDLISPKDYMNILTNAVTHDKSLALYFKQNNEIDKCKSVLMRVKLMNEEIKELEHYLNNE